MYYSKHITEQIEKKRENNNERYERGFYYSPSNIGGCERELYLQAAGIAAFQPDTRLQAVMQEGEIHENAWREQMKQAYGDQIRFNLGISLSSPIKTPRLLANCECPVCKNHIKAPALHGHIDGAVQNGSGYEILEHKAISSHWWDATWKTLQESAKNGSADNFIRRHQQYFIQQLIYLMSLSEWQVKQKADPVTYGNIMYKNKNTGEYIEIRLKADFSKDIVGIEGIYRNFSKQELLAFPIEYKGFLSDLWKKIQRIENAISDPGRRFELQDSHKCQYCTMKEKCQQTFNIQINPKAEKTYIILDTDAGNSVDKYLQMKTELTDNGVLQKVKDMETIKKDATKQVVQEYELVAKHLKDTNPVLVTKQGYVSFNTKPYVTIDNEKLANLPENEQKIVQKVLVHQERTYPVIRPMSQKMSKVLEKAQTQKISTLLQQTEKEKTLSSLNPEA